MPPSVATKASTTAAVSSSSSKKKVNLGKSPAAKVKEIMESAEVVLKTVDQSHIVSFNKCRDFPKFSLEEIEMGPLLGTGGFSGVKEVLKLHHPENKEASPKKQEEQQGQEKDKASNERDMEAIEKLMKEKKEGSDADDHHYDVEQAKQIMSEQCLRFGSARYAIKRLKPELSAVDKARGALDLAIEIKFLSVIWHPNIVKMRAISDTPRMSTDTFIIMDRLYGTLDDKIEEWSSSQAMLKGCCGIVDKKNPATMDLLKERLLVAYDLTVAFAYLHHNKLVYRDIKPENIGFDIRGDMKLFDFGLSKSLDRKLKVKNGGYGYNLTKMTGSIPYMAPEIALGRPYDIEADVYSFSVLLWEIITLEWAYNGYLVNEYILRVCKGNERLPLKNTGTSWPVIIKTIVKEGWDANPQKRPSMKRIGTLLRAELEDLSADASIIDRTEHMMNRSRRSMHVVQYNLDNSTSGGGSRHRRRSVLSSRSERQSFMAGVGGSAHGSSYHDIVDC